VDWKRDLYVLVDDRGARCGDRNWCHASCTAIDRSSDRRQGACAFRDFWWCEPPDTQSRSGPLVGRAVLSSILRSCRLVYVVGQLGAGGLERQLCLLLQGMDRDRYRPEVVCWSVAGNDPYVLRLEQLGVPLHRFTAGMSPARKMTALRRLIVRMRPEVVHSYSFHTNIAAWWATLGTDTLAIGAVQSDFISDKQWTGAVLGRLNARWPRRQIYNNARAAENARRSWTPFVPGRTFIVRNGLDLKSFHDVPPPSDGRVCIAAIGSLLPVKRWDRVLTAAAELTRRGLDFAVEIAGEGPMRKSLENQSQSLGLNDRIRFLGYLPNVEDLLGRATFLVHTSDAEGCPNAVLEAMACGRAVVATDVGDVPALVEDGATGFVVARHDAAALADRMAALISSPDRCRRMGDAGRAKAERDFSLERLVFETMGVYRASGWQSA